MGRIGLPEIILIVVVVLLLFGPRKLPEIADALGKAIRQFKKASKDVQNDLEEPSHEKKNEQKP